MKVLSAHLKYKVSWYIKEKTSQLFECAVGALWKETDYDRVTIEKERSAGYRITKINSKIPAIWIFEFSGLS